MRSLLFVPAHDNRKCDKGLVSGADALILDLEDAVPPPEKALARQRCADFVARHRERMRLFVRVNALSTGEALADLNAIVPAAPYGLMLPKCESGRDVARLAALIAEREAAAEPLRILPIVTETAASLFHLGSYAADAGPRLCGLFWGGEDLAADIGARANRDAQQRYTAPYAMARALTLLGATAARVPAYDAVYTDFRNPAGLRAEADEAERDGFSGKVAIHPDQIAPIHTAFTPTEAALAQARRIVAAFDAAPTAGALALDGRMLDRPHYLAAQRLLAR
ncbi:citrate lyase subunit beta / citryl-CoA lyase [Variovorax sp. CF079]|uniref:HpcH/HpaI aldolase/citrate lyase family protein n=1 Tax=Variovorax sp. CF079 TaxID=1882774 RepID=UPI00088B7D36|nr:CoA ester lyase [Variovorax sp. CF079]SDE80222.1 citrate lyase subunit beta / citryl-CoA lyase [Variovorax sp. CF079]